MAWTLDRYEITYGYAPGGPIMPGLPDRPPADTCRITVLGIAGLAGDGEGPTQPAALGAAVAHLREALAGIDTGLDLLAPTAPKGATS